MIRLQLVMALSALALVCRFAPLAAQDKNEAKEKPVPLLKVGDPAPALKVTRWLQGNEVQKFEPGKAYVVHFWAPWCDSCVRFMPLLAEHQAAYKDKGLTVISLSVLDPLNSEKDVAAFVKKRGPNLKYTFAFAGDRAMYDNWVTAAGVSTMSCTFVVDKAGRIASISHPMYLCIILPKVVANNQTAQAIGELEAKVRADLVEALNSVSRDPKVGLKALKVFEARYPPMADSFIVVSAKLGLLSRYGNPGEAKEYAESVVTKGTKKNDILILRQASAILRRDGKESRELLALALMAAKEVVRIEGEKDAQSLIDVADAYFAIGDKAKAKEFANKAVHVASGESSPFKESIEKEARRLGSEK